MSRALVVLTDGAERSKAINWINKAPTGTRVQFLAAQRSVDQNSKLWAMLSEVAAQCPWHGVKLTTEDWKFIFLDALKRELRVVPNLDGNGFVTEGASSNAWIVTKDGRAVTRPTGGGILAGITRGVLIDVLAELQIKLEERPFTPAEAREPTMMATRPALPSDAASASWPREPEPTFSTCAAATPSG